MWMNQAFKLSFDADVLVFLATFSKHWAKCYSVFWSDCLLGTNALAYLA